MKKRVNFKNLFENGILCLEFGGMIKSPVLPMLGHRSLWTAVN